MKIFRDIFSERVLGRPMILSNISPKKVLRSYEALPEVARLRSLNCRYGLTIMYCAFLIVHLLICIV